MSDERVKDEIANFKESGLSIIRKIEPIVFKFREGTQYFDGRQRLGLSAQNLLAASPFLASETGNESGSLLQPEPLAMQGLTFMGMKELDDKIAMLDERINTLRELWDARN